MTALVSIEDTLQLKRGEKILPGYKYVDIATGLYEVYGGEVDWFHQMLGVFTFTNELFTVGVFPVLLREDPRYFRRGSGSGLRRTGYAISRVLVARTDAGAHRLNYSEFLGNFTSGAISTAYYPNSERGFSDIASRAAFQIGYDALFNILKEFYPDIKKKFRKKSK